MRRLLLAALVGAVPPAVAADPAVRDAALVAEIREKNRLADNLAHLSDRIGPRLTGSAGLERANRWAEATMKASGLENVRQEPWEIPVGWERGSAKLKLTAPVERELRVASAGWAPGTNGPVSGRLVILEIKTKEDMQKYRGKLKNAVLLRGAPAEVRTVTEQFSPPPAAKPGDKPAAAPPPRRPGDPERPRMSLDELRAFAREVDDFLAAEGAACTLRDAGKPHALLVTTGSWRGSDRGAAQNPLPSLFVAHEDYRLLHRLATSPAEAETKLEVNVSNRFVPGPITCYNTVGEVRGAEKPDEFVVVGAHVDSWDLASGTTDNGTGTSVVLEAARAVAARAAAGDRPKRTIRFVLFSGEEQGLFGSKEYVKRHEKEMPKTSAALVHDTGTGAVVGIGLQGRPAVKEVMDKELDALKELKPWQGLSLESSGGTDHLSFESAGVPGFACRQEPGEYRLTHHTQSDTLDKAVLPNLVQGAQVMAVAARRVADLPELLPRAKPERKKDGERKEPEPEKKPAAAGN